MSTLAIIAEEEIQSATTILTTTRSWVSSYKAKHDKLKAKAEAEGVKLSKEMDTELNDYLVSLRTAAKKAEEARKPFTQKMDQIKSLFTHEENILKNELSKEIQGLRDASAKIYSEEAAQKATEQAKELAQAKLKAELKVAADSMIRTKYAEYLNYTKSELFNLFNGLEIGQIDAFVEELQAASPALKEEIWQTFAPVLEGNPLYAAYEGDFQEIIDASMEGKFELVQPHYHQEIKAYIEYIISLVPQRKKDIEAGVAEQAAAKLKAEQEEQAKAQEEANKKLEEEAKAKEVSKAVIDVQIKSEAENFNKPNPQTIDSYTIQVLNNQGWAEIFKFFIAHSGKDITEKTTLGTMRIFAEAEAKRSGEMIVSDALLYEPKYKTVVKSKKAA